MRNSLNRYILLAKRWAWMILLGMVICGGTTYIVAKLMRPTYQATAYLILTVSTSQSGYDNTTTAIELQPTYSQLVTKPQVLNPIASKYGLTLEQLTNMITVKPQSNTQLIEVDVKNSDPHLAAQIANNIAQQFSLFAATTLNTSAQVNMLPAQAPTKPAEPGPATNALFGALVGLGLALALILVFEWIDDRIDNPEEVQKILGLDVLTILPALSQKQRTQDVEEVPALAEGCRILSATLNMAQAKKTFKLAMVTSALASEGKSTLAANLASFLALSGKRVLLVDADLRHPVLDQHFQINSRQGLSDACRAQFAVDLTGQPTEIPSLRLLPAGVLPSNPVELLQSPLTRQLFEYFKATELFDYILFDTPPVLPVADAQILASYIETTIFLADISKTPRKILTRAVQTLHRTGTTLLGVAVNKSQWSEYGDIHDYLSNLQRQKPVITPPISAGLESIDDTFEDMTAITAIQHRVKWKQEETGAVQFHEIGSVKNWRNELGQI